MTDISNRGLGSDNMDEQTKHDIQSEGGKASHSGGNSNSKGGQSSTGQGNFENHEQHVKAGEQSSGHTNDPEEHKKAGKIGGSK